MAHSIELLFDPATEAAIRAIWQRMDEAGLPSQNRVDSPTNRPHVTLLAAQRISPEVDDALGALAGRFPIRCVVGAPVIFSPGPSGGSRHTLARLIVPSAELLALHAEVYHRSLPYLTGAPFGHCRPGRWTAHATLGRRLNLAEVGSALAIGGSAGVDLNAEVTVLRRWDSDARIDRLLVGRPGALP